MTTQNNELSHFGIKGMKWGRRRAVTTPTYQTRDTKTYKTKGPDRKFDKKLEKAIAKDAKKGNSKKVTKLISKLAKQNARNEHNTAVNTGRNVQIQIADSVLAKYRANPKQAKKDAKRYKKQQKYIDAYINDKKVSEADKVKMIKDVANSRYGTRFTDADARAYFDYQNDRVTRSSARVTVDRAIAEVQAKNKNFDAKAVSANLEKKVKRADRRGKLYHTSDDELMHFGKKGMKWGVRKKRGGGSDQTTPSKRISEKKLASKANKILKKVGNAFKQELNVAMLKPAELSKWHALGLISRPEFQTLMLINLYKKNITIKHSDTDDELMHFGIKGMRWGIRRRRNSSSSTTTPSKNTITLSRDKYETLKSKKKPVKELSNKELQDYISRANLERQYKDLLKSEARASRSAGRKFVEDVVIDSAKTAATQYASAYLQKQTKVMLEKAVKAAAKKAAGK